MTRISVNPHVVAVHLQIVFFVADIGCPVPLSSVPAVAVFDE
ncbi:hypothetical protein [Photorhabdus asymbiotica]